MSEAPDHVGEIWESEPGLIVERRCVFATLAAIIATAGMGPLKAGHAREVARRRLSFEEFLADTAPVARRLVKDTSSTGQDTYLKTVASYAVLLADVPIPAMKDSGQGAGPGTFIGFNPGGDPFTVLHWRMEPGTEIRAHAHTYGNVVTLGLEGRAHVVNYEVVGKRDYSSGDLFRARRTARQLLQRGDVNLVSLERNYIHGLRAGPQGARGLDITTRIRPKEPTPYLILKDRDAAVSEASWRFDPPAAA